MKSRQALVSWSGGKDSALCLQALRADPGVEIVGLLTSVTRDYDRVSIHGVRRSLLEQQAASLRLPLFTIDLDPVTTNDAYERSFLAALERVKRALPEVDAIAFGDLFLEDVKAYREKLLAGSGFEPLFPLWGLDTASLAQRFVRDGFAARLVCIDTTQLDESFAQRSFDDTLLADLPNSVDPCGERGEFHTFVSDGPGYHSPVNYRLGDIVVRDQRFAFADLLPWESAATS
jgi:uncharacterized protein (TIGR00290 family)